MAVFKCKMCGGDLEVQPGMSVGVCQYCGTQQTLPRLDSEKKQNLYDRANHFRRNNEYDRAMGIYEQILSEDNTDAEAYWSIVLCRYGVEYVEDPETKKQIPTINRTQFTSIFADEDYQKAIQYADVTQKEVYEKEAQAIDEIQKGILAISEKEEPFDVFICYKETDKRGRRTLDSVLAMELYNELVEEGLRVFFARITLEDKLGSAYEPYIFGALNSAKVMVVLGTSAENFNAAWVKNEWSRYLGLIKAGAKKTLIPAYKDMDPYDLPEEFSALQAQDMGKIGWMQDMVRGIKKLIGVEEGKVQNAPAQSVGPDEESLLKRGQLFLEDEDWENASEYFDRVLDIDPEYAPAYIGKLCAALHLKKEGDLANWNKPLDQYGEFEKAWRFAQGEYRETIAGYQKTIADRLEEERKEKIYQEAKEKYESNVVYDILKSQDLFQSIAGYRDAAQLATTCSERADIVRKQNKFAEALSRKEKAENEMQLQSAAKLFRELGDFNNAVTLAAECERMVQELIKEKKDQKKRKLKIAGIISSAIIILVAIILIVTNVIIPNAKYGEATSILEQGDYPKAALLFSELGDFSDSKEKVVTCIQTLRDTIKENHVLDAGSDHTVAVKQDGTVLSVGSNGYGKSKVDNWKDIIAVSAGTFHTVGLKTDGTVVAIGSTGYGRCNVGGWKDIIAISAGDNHTVGLKADGTVISTGREYFNDYSVSQWEGLVAVSAGYRCTVGLKADGTVMITGDNDAIKQSNIQDWKDIVAVSVGHNHIVGLKTDGTVVAGGDYSSGKCEVGNWKNIKLPA